MIRNSHEIAGQVLKVLYSGAWAGYDGYTKVSQPTPWRLRSKHIITMANQSINQ